MRKPEAYTPQHGKGLLDLMKAAGVPQTPNNFMNLNFLGDPPKKLPAEQRHDVPQHLQPYVS